MNLIQRVTLALARRSGALKPARRQFSAARVSNLTASWTRTPQPVDYELRQALRILRARSREQGRNNDYMKRFLAMCRTHVVGPNGIVLQAQPLDPGGRVDQAAADVIEGSFLDWGHRLSSPDVTGQLSWRDVQRLFIATVAQDGEACVWLRKGTDLNKWRFSVEFIDAEALDVDRQEELRNGNVIVMGVEMTPNRRPVAYHLRVPKPNVDSYMAGDRSYVRVPAGELLHCYLPEMVWQSRGIPWATSALLRLNMLGGYEEAEVTAARIAAAKMGFFTDSADGDAYMGDSADADGNIISEVAPGTFERLPPGVDFKPFDPQHPSTAYKDFVKACLRGVASGLGVSYNSLANDLEGVNYSSIRQGVLEERDIWKTLQDWMIESFCEPVYRSWLDSALMAGALVLPNGGRLRVETPEKYRRVTWQPRRWSWVDPQSDMQANILAIEKGICSVSEVIRERGRDPADVWRELEADKASLESLGLSISAAPKAPAPNPEADAEDDEMRKATLLALARETPAPVVNVSTPPVTVNNTPAAVQVDVAEHPEVAARMENAVTSAVTHAVTGLRESVQETMTAAMREIAERMVEVVRSQPAPVVNFTPPPQDDKVVQFERVDGKLQARVRGA